MLTVMSPLTSVRQTRVPEDPRSSSVADDGWPNELSAPTLTSASRADHTDAASRVSPLSLPWCGTLSTSTGRSSPASAIPACAASSASPVSTASKPPHRTCSTTLVSFVPSGSALSPGGHRTSTPLEPIRQRSPMRSPRYPESAPAIARATAPCRRTASAATCGTPTQPTDAVPESPPTPPVWSSCA